MPSNTRKQISTPRKRNTTRKSVAKSTKNYVVAIPSYNREEVLARKTLKTLHDGGVPASVIHIFVANSSEYHAYQSSIPKELYGKIIIGKLGISAQRQCIVDHFPEGQAIVSMDDDIEGVFKRISPTKLRPIRHLHAFFQEAFQTMQSHHLYIWGVYPTPNPFFMRGGITTKLKFLIGGLYGFINRPHDTDLRLSGHADQKEDIEQSILYYVKDGGVVRYNNIAFKTKFHAPGGLGQTPERISVNLKSAKYLEKTYPDLATRWQRPNGMAEIRLRGKEP